MIFNSFPFLVFFVFFLLAYWNLQGRSRLCLCLAGSYFFYGWWNWYLLSLILLSTSIDYFIGGALAKTESPSRRRLLVMLSIFSNLGILGFFKYFNFFAGNLATLAGQFGWTLDWATLNILLPVGISFYTFQSLSYTIDVYRKRIPSEPDFVRFATFVAFFPQLVAGPIVRASEFLPQLQTDREYEWSDTVHGFGQVLLGFFKKLVVADSIAVVVDPMFDFPEGYGALNIVMLMCLFSVQIYCDFAGYSDIAIGAARMLGYEFPKNFDYPFFASSLGELWRRWHMTFCTWLRDYVYIPLGGSRGGSWLTSRNLFLTMVIGGFWHGAAWTYVLWGALWGIAMIVERMVQLQFAGAEAGRSLSPLVRIGGKIMGPVFVFGFFTFTLIIFRSDSLGQAGLLLRKIAALEGLSPSDLHNRIPLLKALAVAATLMGGEFLCQFISVSKLLDRASLLRPVVYAALLWAIALLGTFDGNAFVYFQF